MESDSAIAKKYKTTVKFQSTLSVWRATTGSSICCAFADISIHALRVESDESIKHSKQKAIAISIHALRVESDEVLVDKGRNGKVFQSTLSVWRATKQAFKGIFRGLISIHALRVESDKIVSL